MPETLEICNSKLATALQDFQRVFVRGHALGLHGALCRDFVLYRRSKLHKLHCYRTDSDRLQETPMSGYALDNSWDRAKRRVALLENFLDPKTKRRLQALGLSRGWDCLEIAAGGGSIAR